MKYQQKKHSSGRTAKVALIIIFGILGQGLLAAKWIEEYGLSGCIELTNGSTRVVLDPNVGGRVLVYESHGRNILYFDDSHNGITNGYEISRIDAGRFDFGPTRVLPDRDIYWRGKWKGEITGELSARLTSQIDSTLKILLIREFTLSKNTSELHCKQKIINLGEQTRHLCHWGRTFVIGGGISLIPVNPNSRFPKGYIGYEKCNNQTVMVFNHKQDPNIRISEFVLETSGIFNYNKIVMDGEEGWMAYLSPNNLLFIKTFDHSSSKKYGEMTAATTSLWQYKDQIYEIEPYGPLEEIAPGDSISFTENWYLETYNFPSDRKADITAVKNLIKEKNK